MNDPMLQHIHTENIRGHEYVALRGLAPKVSRWSSRSLLDEMKLKIAEEEARVLRLVNNWGGTSTLEVDPHFCDCNDFNAAIDRRYNCRVCGKLNDRTVLGD